MEGSSGILSIDIQPGDERFATAGRAEGGAGLVVIWSFRLLTESLNKGGQGALKLLCRSENHGGCVNCVRWSESGRYLASAGDDSFITIMQYVGRLASAPGDNLSAQTSEVQNVERWKCVQTLRGHGGDVLHVAWSPGDTYLASCSIDNQIIVWCGPGSRFGERVATLSGHQSLVKGITWDPVGMYLASQSDDRSLRIWTTGNWKLKKAIQKPFEECGATTQFLRLDWSPDGNVIASAHAMNNGGPVSKLIDRGGWESERDLVGHRKAITCARWSPCFYEMTRPGSSKPVQFCVCAVGSKDRSFSLWSTEQRRPLGVAYDAFTQTLMDISWSRSGRYMMLCSSDSTIACYYFAEKEIGRILSSEEKAGIMQQSYGKHGIPVMANGYTNGHDAGGVADRHFVIDNPDMAKLHHAQKSESTPTTTNTKPEVNGVENMPRPSTSTAEPVLNGHQTQQPPKPLPQQKQVEIRTKDGKRRIQPIFLGAAVIAEPMDDAVAPTAPTNTIDKVSLGTTAAPVTNGPDRSSLPAEASSTQLPHNNQMETQVPSTSATVPSAKTPPVESSAPLKNLQIKRKQGEAPVTQPAKKSRQHPTKPRRNRQAILSDDEDDEAPTHPEKEDQREVDPDETIKPMESTSGDARTISLSVPDKCNQLTVHAEMATNRGNDRIKIICQNGIRVTATGPAVSKLQAMRGDAPLWNAVVSSEVLALSANLHIVAAAGTDKRLTVFKASNGKRLMPPLVLDSDISVLQTNRYCVMSVSSSGTVQVWCFEGTYSCLCKESILPILTNSNTSVSSGFITDYGMPALTLSNGKSYEYNSTMRSWISVFDPQDPMTAASMVRTRSTLMDSLKLKGPFSDCLREGTKLASAAKSQMSSSSDGAHGHQNALVVAGFLESQMNSAFELRSAQEFRFWLMQYVHHLVKGGLANELKLFCEDLMESESGNAATTSEKEASLLGLSSWTLLKEIVPVIATNPKLQRLYGEMKEQLAARQLKDTENRAHGNDSML